MPKGKLILRAALCLSASLLSSCGKPDSGARNTPVVERNDGDKVLNLLTWSDYLAPDTISSFEKQTGIKVRIGYIDSLETLQTRMLTGSSGFDVVVPSGAFYFKQEIRSGAYLPLDNTKLPNRANLDPSLMSQIEPNDPGNAHGVIYTWGTLGIGYNEKMVRERLPKEPLNSWRLLFDPAFAAKLSSCGINLADDAVGIVQLALKYMGRDPNTSRPQDFADVEILLTKIRPFVRNIDTSGEIEAMANGDVCISLAYNGDFVQARSRAKEAKNGINLKYVIPDEGSLIWFSLLAIPKDAPHVANAHLFINYLMNPQVIANITNFIGNANANSAATPLLDASIASDTAIYPTHDEQKRLFLPGEESPEQTRAITRLWQKFKTGQ
jgi:putrescine transport system substrate-binding protein